jgi:2,4-dienoyl-CoA reductase-like NADH-dependent reductase (Old Yellow Enzyme family)
MDALDVLRTPLKLPCGASLPNRLAKAAMSENLADDDGGPSERLIRLYETLGAGGAGLLITGNVIVAPGGRTEPHNVVVEDERHLPALRRWAAAAQAHGARLMMQISHAGRQTPKMVTSYPVGPSDIPLRGMAGLFARPRPLLPEEIHGLVARFATTARVAKAAGFAGVQIHGAHGYLVSQFLSPRSNVRDDEWGGSLQGRTRFLLEIVAAMRAAVGPAFPISVKLNSADFQKGGFSLEESMQVAQALEAAGIDLLEISGGSYESPRMMGGQQPVRDSTRTREAFFLEYAEQMRGAVTLPLMLTGGFRSAAAMADALAGGAIDLVGIARPIALEPDLPARLLRGEATRAQAQDPRVGVRLLDDMLQLGWYQRQLARVGDGLAPSERLSAWGTVARMLGANLLTVARRAVAPAPRDDLALVSAGATR